MGVVLIARPTFLFGDTPSPGTSHPPHFITNATVESISGSASSNITQHTGLLLRDFVVRVAAASVGVHPDIHGNASSDEIGPSERGTSVQRIGAIGYVFDLIFSTQLLLLEIG